MIFRKKTIEIDALLFSSKVSLPNKNATNSINSVKFKLKSLALEETAQKPLGQDIMTPTFLEHDSDSALNIEHLPDMEKNIYAWLDERNVILANPKEKLYSYFQKNRDKVLMTQKKKTHIGEDSNINEPNRNGFLNFTNSPLLMRRENKIMSMDKLVHKK